MLAEGGVDSVRVEVLAKRLGVTKGGFYGYFADRSALLEEMLDSWERQSVDEVLEEVHRDESDPRTTIRRAGQLTFSGDRLQPIDLAIRDWARRDEAVGQRLRRVDNRRMQLLRENIATFCDDAEEVEARSLLAFCVAIGTHLVVAEHQGRTRADVLDKAAKLLLKMPDGSGADR